MSEDVCHCGQSVDKTELRNRGMCTDCDDARCDAFPGECDRRGRPSPGDNVGRFLLARIAEDEAVARATTDAPWVADSLFGHYWTVTAEDAPELGIADMVPQQADAEWAV